MLNPIETVRERAAALGLAIWALITAALAVGVFVWALTIQAMDGRAASERAAQAADQHQNATTAALTLLLAVTDAEAGVRGYLLTGEAGLLRPLTVARARVAAAAESLQHFAALGPHHAGKVGAAVAAADARLLLAEQAAVASDRESALGFVRQAEGKRLSLELRRRVEELLIAAYDNEEAIRRIEAREVGRGRLAQAAMAAVTLIAMLLAMATIIYERGAARRANLLQARLNAELRQASDQAREASAAKSRFLATASHDMRQPLHAMALYISALERRVGSDEARDMLAKMDSAVRSMTRLFNALLDLARLEAGVLKPEAMDFAIDALLADAAEHAVGAVKVRVAPSGLHVHSDPDLLEIILRNLAGNAVKHSRGGRVLIGCRRVGPNVRIEVHDNGAGIAPDKLQAIFGEFVRGEAARGSQGVGLGLAIVERMADLLNHRLTVRSELGRGSVFAITVPRAAAAGMAPEPAADDLLDLEGARLLVADDEPLSLDAMAQALRDAGAQVTTADSAAEARARGLAAFELSVLDLDLGDSSALDLLAAVEAQTGRPARALIVTGSTSPEVLNRLRDSGRDWISKPVDAGVLTARVCAALRRRAT
ncbi:ATP-binding protein [Phenylobacterium sp.]|uniref:ATP-binding response regulator n=1 Tax=Phenylobacterium sp. TaxID=1871053 RepID=UPI00378450B9